MPARAVALLAVAVAVAGCGGGNGAATDTASAPAARSAPPAKPLPLYRRLTTADAVLRAGIVAWRSAPGPPGGPLPDAASAAARHLQAAVARLADHRRLRAATLARLPSRLRSELRDLNAARDDLRRLSAGWPAHRVRTGPPTPLAELLRSYRAAQRRFGIGWNYLAAINLVESAFGRVRSRSVAGAQGPMQFMPSSWRAYGLGGNIEDPGDAILGAANLLSRAGAPGSYARALYAYNPSHLYVDAVRRYAGVIGRDPDGLYLLYSWPAG